VGPVIPLTVEPVKLLVLMHIGGIVELAPVALHNAAAIIFTSLCNSMKLLTVK
jgi:hypothetical protein